MQGAECFVVVIDVLQEVQGEVIHKTERYGVYYTNSG